MYQLPHRSCKLNFFTQHMDRVFWAERWLHITQRWPSGSLGPELFLSLYQAKVKVGFWPSVAKRSKGRCFISTKVNPRHSQTTKWSITDHFSIDQNHQGPFQRCRSNIWKNPKNSRFPIRTISATPYGTFIRPRKCLEMLQEWRARDEDSKSHLEKSNRTSRTRVRKCWKSPRFGRFSFGQIGVRWFGGDVPTSSQVLQT